MTIAASGVTKPEAGVIATNPATAPLAAPRTVGLPLLNHSAYIHDSVAAAVAVLVATMALVAKAPDANALPPLNPNQPIQSIAAPMTEKGKLCRNLCSGG